MRNNHSKRRDAIYELLKTSKSHPSAKTIYEKLKSEYPNISLGTVYRNINFFIENDNIFRVANVAGEDRFDACLEPHSHFVCTKCGNIYDIENKNFEYLNKTLENENFKVDKTSVVFYGLCRNCNK